MDFVAMQDKVDFALALPLAGNMDSILMLLYLSGGLWTKKIQRSIEDCSLGALWLIIAVSMLWIAVLSGIGAWALFAARC